jgi:Ca-activated chloride channel homolog
MSCARRAGGCAPFLVFLLLAWQAARAQTAEEFFNSGAQLYISNNIPSALERTENGLKLYPDDVRLKKLAELLKQQQQQQRQKQQQNQRPNQQHQQNQQNKSQPQQNKNQQDRSQQNQQLSKQNQQQQNQSARQQQNESGQKKNEQPQAAQGKAMTPEQAKRLLDSQKDNEQVLQLKPPQKPEDQNQPIKDW